MLNHNFVQLKSIVAISLSLLLLLNTVINVEVLLWYGMNQDSIASTLCINKNEPEKKCKGCCVLNEKLSLNHSESNSENEVPQINIEQSNYLLPRIDVVYAQLSAVSTSPLINSNNITQLFQRDIFHPPRIV